MNNKGFTLIETLISILLLAIVLAGGLSLYFNGNEMVTLSTHKKMALEIANSKMEDLKAGGYVNLPSAGAATTTSIQVGSLNALQSVTVTNMDEAGVGGAVDYKQVDVNIDWSEGGKFKAGQQVKLSTYLSP